MGMSGNSRDVSCKGRVSHSGNTGDPGNTIPLARQLSIFDKHAREAVYYLLDYLERHGHELIDQERDRMSSVGVHDYGDASFHKDRAELERELAEECCDALMYAALICWRLEELRRKLV